MQGHQAACEFALIKCVHSKCKGKFRRSNLGKHLESECEYRNVKCESCGKLDIPFVKLNVSMTMYRPFTIDL